MSQVESQKVAVKEFLSYLLWLGFWLGLVVVVCLGGWELGHLLWGAGV